MLLTDTNILQRVSLGRAGRHVERLRHQDVTLATTAHNIVELRHNLRAYGLASQMVDREVDRILAFFDLLMPGEYGHMRVAADARLSEGGKADWPLLAAALALDADIWSEDRDFFGVGVPVWTTGNLRFVERD